MRRGRYNHREVRHGSGGTGSRDHEPSRRIGLNVREGRRPRRPVSGVFAVGGLLALCGFLALPAVAQAREAMAELYVRDRYIQVQLLGRDGDAVQYRLPNAPAGVQVTVPLRDVLEARFVLEPHGEELGRLLEQHRTAEAGRLLYLRIRPFIPFLDLPYNNAADTALQAANLLMRTGRAPGLEARQARPFFEMAEGIYRVLARADWYPWAASADVRVAQTQLALAGVDAARRHMDQMATPVPGDGMFGLYWLVRAEMAREEADYGAAIEAAVQSVAFESKDIQSFPDALLLTAELYETLGEYHRARDVFYEMARLFVGTAWQERADTGLRRIMDTGLTDVEEERDVADLFFALNEEDINELAREYLESLDR